MQEVKVKDWAGGNIRYRFAQKRLLNIAHSGPGSPRGKPQRSRLAKGFYGNDGIPPTNEAEAFALVRSISQETNKHSAQWLWECFERTGPENPIHMACLVELYGLFIRGIGAEHVGRFIRVAKAAETPEPDLARMYAIDALGLVVQKRVVSCKLKRNSFRIEFEKPVVAKARSVLRQLATASNKQLRQRAKAFLESADSNDKAKNKTEAD
ncbi:MAG: hypothetical protein KGZ25_14455 [Planctomycetes bacterium]|nr:hypothetical protein [Planctomycetota bacterium]